MGCLRLIASPSCAQCLHVSDCLEVVSEVIDLCHIGVVLWRVVPVRHHSEPELQTLCFDFILDVVDDVLDD